MVKKIGIVGAGTAGLHLGLQLLEHGVDVTMFTERRPDDYADMRLLNTVAHHAVTIDRENALGVNRWADEDCSYGGHYYYFGTHPKPLRFYGDLHAPSRAVDYRIYHPALMEDFMNRGGRIEFRQVHGDEVSALSARFDLIVVSTGKGPFGQMFAHQPEHSAFTRPQRALCVGIFKGIAQRPKRGVTMYFSPGAGEMIEIPITTFNGLQTALVMENIAGGELEVLAKAKYSEDRRAFLDLLLDKLRKHYPDCAERVDERRFDLANGPLDILQGGVTPTVRKSFAPLDSGKIAVALGDVHAVVDPLLGQGGNIASYSAAVLADEIVAQDVYDERFVERLDLRRQDRVLGAMRWTNYMLEHLAHGSTTLQRFIGLVSEHRVLADAFTDNFNYPERQWDCFATVERIRAWCAGHVGSEAASVMDMRTTTMEDAA